jgi:hypothetical protein
MKSINRKGRKGFKQRSQRADLKGFFFVCFTPSLCALWLKETSLVLLTQKFID